MRYNPWLGTSVSDIGAVQGLSNAYYSGCSQKIFVKSDLVVKFCEPVLRHKACIKAVSEQTEGLWHSDTGNGELRNLERYFGHGDN
jgi:hypothetical protein